MIRNLFLITVAIFALSIAASAQRGPSTATHPIIIKAGQEIEDAYKALAKQEGNKAQDIVPLAGNQMRVAIFHDSKREGDQFELHDTSDDIYYVLEGEATLALGGTLSEPKEISPGEWRSKTAAGTKNVAIHKGDLIVVPRGTVHQRTVTGKGFSMILVKVFAETQKAQ